MDLLLALMNDPLIGADPADAIERFLSTATPEQLREVVRHFARQKFVKRR